MKVPAPIEPRHPVEPLGFNDQRLTVPSTIRPAHPTGCRRWHMVLHIHGPYGSRKLMQNHNVIGTLDNLEWIGHVGRPWHAWQITLNCWVPCHAISKVVIPLLKRL